MRKELEKICLSFELSKLAYEKGFRELCVFGVNQEEHFPICDENFDLIFERFEEEENGVYCCPTHLQVIAWLNEKYDIQVMLKVTGRWKVIQQSGHTFFKDEESEFEVNEAIEIALNLI